MYKESDHIHIIALSSVMDITVRIVYMVNIVLLCVLVIFLSFFQDRGAGGKVNVHDFTNPLKEQSRDEAANSNNLNSNNGNSKDGPRVHLLYRPGHYDILYVLSKNNNNENSNNEHIITSTTSTVATTPYDDNNYEDQ